MFRTKLLKVTPQFIINPDWLPIKRRRKKLFSVHRRELISLRNQLRTLTPQKDIDKLAYLANHDALTHLPNRRLLYQHLDQALIVSADSGYYGALLFMDIDNFKTVNDTYGHEAGDQLLIELAKRIKHSLDDNDLVARFGGDEFVVLIHKLKQTYTHSCELVKIYAQRISQAVKHDYIFAPQSYNHNRCNIRPPTKLTCTASIGVSLFINHNSTREEILKRADTAMYEAKSQGRNQVCLWQESMR